MKMKSKTVTDYYPCYPYYPIDGGDPTVAHMESDTYKARLDHAAEEVKKMKRRNKTVTTDYYPYYPIDGGDPTVAHLERDAYKARLVHAMKQGNVRYDIRHVGGNVYHLKAGHLSTNIVVGFFGQCIKYDVDLSNPQVVRVHSAVPWFGWFGGAWSAKMHANQGKKVTYLLQMEFPQRRVVWS
jgi:hypothetical protein